MQVSPFLIWAAQGEGLMWKTLPPVACHLGSVFLKETEGLVWEFEEWAVVTPNVVALLQDVNDHAPECEPPFQELTIYTPLGRSLEVTKVSCWIPQEPQRLALSYSIMGGVNCGGHEAVCEDQTMVVIPSSPTTLLPGNSQSRFRLQGTILMHNDTVLGPPWPEQPCTYELLIRVADVGPSSPHLSTTATIIVHLVPWRASTVATSTYRSTVRGFSGPWGIGREDLEG